MKLMNVVVSGATGLIGTALLNRLLEQGHHPSVLSRSPENAARVLGGSVPVYSFDYRCPPRSIEPLEQADAVVHLAGESVKGRWTKKKRKEILQSRQLSTRLLSEKMLQINRIPQTFICASAIGYYGDSGDRELTESSPGGRGFLPEVCRAWEAEACKAGAGERRVVSMRFGIVLGREGGAFKEMLPLFRMGLGGPLGCGNQWWSWVHIEDAVNAILHALKTPLRGPVNVVSNEPARQKAFAIQMGKQLKRPALVPTPSSVLKLALGGFSTELLSSRRAVPENLKKSGFTFSYPELEGALSDLIHKAPGKS